MKTLRALALAACLASASPAWAAWTFVSAGTIATPPSPFVPGLPAGHVSGDLLVWVGYERNSSNAVSIPAGYTEIYSITANAKFFVVAAKIDGGSESAPSTTGGTVLAQLAAFRGGPATLTGIVHASANTSSTCTTTPPIAALTVSQDNTLVLGISEQIDNYTSFTSNPAGFTTVDHNAYDGTNDLSLMWGYQIQTTATNIAASTFTTAGATSSTCRGVTLALTTGGAGAGGVAITSVNTTNSVAYTDVTKSAVVANAGAAQGGSTFKVIDQGGSVKATETINSWAATSIGFDVAQGNVRNGPITWELVVGVNTATKAGTLTVPTGEWYVDLTNLATLDFNLAGTAVNRIRGQPNRYYDYPTDLANGDQMHCKRTAGSGNLNATIAADGTKVAGLSTDGVLKPDSTVTQIQCRFWHGGTWGSFQTWDISGAAPVFIGPNP